MDLISGLRYEAATEHHALNPELAAAFTLDGRTAVVTGAAGGIGRETAAVFARAGANVVLADRDGDGLAETAAAVEALSVKAVTVPTDVTAKSEVDDLARAALRGTGRVDVWANVAGVLGHSLIVETTEAELDRILDVNLKGVYWGVAAAARAMAVAKKGSIVNVASAGGEMPAPRLSIYGMTKAAVIHLTKIAATELGPQGIRVNAIAPGFVETSMTKYSWTNADGSLDEGRREETLKARSSQAALGVNGTPLDMALAMLYLAADASRFMTGQVLRPNGGVYMA